MTVTSFLSSYPLAATAAALRTGAFLEGVTLDSLLRIAYGLEAES